MPGVKKADSVRAADFIKGAAPETRAALLAVLSEDDSNAAFQAVKFFRDSSPETARAVLDIVTYEVKAREPDSPQKKGAEKRKANAAAPVTNSPTTAAADGKGKKG